MFFPTSMLAVGISFWLRHLLIIAYVTEIRFINHAMSLSLSLDCVENKLSIMYLEIFCTSLSKTKASSL